MLIVDETAPTYEQLRPLKPATSTTFPVYRDLADRLVSATSHPADDLAHVMATCSGYAYSDAATVAMIMARMGLNDNHCRMIGQVVDAMFIYSTTFLVQSADGRVVIVAYRGTEPTNIVNWLIDAEVYPERVPFGFGATPQDFDVHAGFYRNVRATRYEVVAALRRAVEGRSVCADGGAMAHPLEALYITGHSLGAALAAMMATMLVTEPAYTALADKLRAVYTYGQPAIGSPAFAAACEANPFLAHNVIRYVYKRDVVPRLPPAAAGPYPHFGPEYRFDESSRRWSRASESTPQLGQLLGLVELPMSFMSRRIRSMRKLPFRYSIDDHGPQNYVTALTPPGVHSEFGV